MCPLVHWALVSLSAKWGLSFMWRSSKILSSSNNGWIHGLSHLISTIKDRKGDCTMGQRTCLQPWSWYKSVASTGAHYTTSLGFLGSSADKESACNAGDPSSIPGLGRSTGEGIGYLLQYSWASLEAQLVKNLPAMWVTWVQSLGRENTLEKERPPTPVFLPGESRGWRSLVGYSPWGHKELDTTEWLNSLSSYMYGSLVWHVW